MKFLLTGAVYVVVVGFWVFMEAISATVLLHRYFTHGSWVARKRWVVLFLLWFVRTSGVKFTQWTPIHRLHHLFVDANWDPHSPWSGNVLTGRPPLGKCWPWRFLDNAMSYTAMAEYLDNNPEFLEEVEELDLGTKLAMDRVRSFADVEKKYTDVKRGQMISLVGLSIAALPLSISITWQITPLAAIPMAIALGVLAVAIKGYLYLLGGYIINFYGHGAEGEEHPSDVPWWLALLTLGMMGEWRHRMHHAAPFAANLGGFTDIGLHVIRLMAVLGLAGDICRGVKVGDGKYRPEIIYPIQGE